MKVIRIFLSTIVDLSFDHCPCTGTKLPSITINAWCCNTIFATRRGRTHARNGIKRTRFSTRILKRVVAAASAIFVDRACVCRCCCCCVSFKPLSYEAILIIAATSCDIEWSRLPCHARGCVK